MNKSNHIRIAISNIVHDPRTPRTAFVTYPNKLDMNVHVLEVGRGLDKHTKPGSTLLGLIDELDGSRVTLDDLQRSLYLIRKVSCAEVELIGRVSHAEWDEIIRAHDGSDIQARIWVETLVGLKYESF